MTITLELPPELEKGLKETATKTGTQPSDVAIAAMQKGLSELKELELQLGYKELGKAQRENPNMYPSNTLDGLDLEDSIEWR
jgi:hypothetical protein